MTKTIIQNEIECKSCGERIWSAHRHDFNYCKCGKVAVDGGSSYLRRLGEPTDIIERSIYMDEAHIKSVNTAVLWAQETGRNEYGVALAVIRALRNAGLLDMKKFKDDS